MRRWPSWLFVVLAAAHYRWGLPSFVITLLVHLLNLPSFVITLLVHLLNHINKYIVGVLLMAFVLRGESAQPVPEPVIEVVKTGFWLPWQKA